MMSAISRPRRLFALCSPRTHLTASTMFDLPHPFGPTITVMPESKSKRVRSANDLKPNNSSRFSSTSRVLLPPASFRRPSGYGSSMVIGLAVGRSPVIRYSSGSSTIVPDRARFRASAFIRPTTSL